MTIVETMTFRLRPGVDDDGFLAADRRVQREFAPTCAGFLRRTTARGEDGAWMVVTLWASPADAEASAGREVDDAAVAGLMAQVDPTSVVRRRYTTLD